MPVGIIINALSVASGGVVGALFGHKLPTRINSELTKIFGVCSMGMGVSSIGLMKNMPAVIFAVIIGTAFGLAVNLGGIINSGGGTCGDRFYPDRSEYNFKDSDTVISDHGGAHRGDHYVYGVSSWKAGWLFPTGISHRSGDVYNKYGWFRQCSCFEQCT